LRYALITGLVFGFLIAFPVFYFISQEYGFTANRSLQTQISNLEEQTTTLQTQLSQSNNKTNAFLEENSKLQTVNSNLSNQAVTFRNQIMGLQEENVELKSQLNQPKTPSLFTRLGVSDVLYSAHYTGSTSPNKSSRPRLFIKGEVWNAGDFPAENCRLLVTLYQQGTAADGYPQRVAVDDTIIELGTIDPWTCVQISKDIYYTGERLSGWSIIPQIGN
jgi:regulator of replication initiation timing